MNNSIWGKVEEEKERKKHADTYYKLTVLVTETASPLGASKEKCAVPWSSGSAVTAP